MKATGAAAGFERVSHVILFGRQRGGRNVIHVGEHLARILSERKGGILRDSCDSCEHHE